MPKDTKSLGNNKAPACESRGFVRKKQKVCILTHLLSFIAKISCPTPGCQHIQHPGLNLSDTRVSGALRPGCQINLYCMKKNLSHHII